MKTVKDTIYLTIARNGVQGMKKSYTGAKKGEIVVKMNVEVDEKAFTPPTIEKFVVVNDWQSDIDVEDVEFNKDYITQEEAEIIRSKRLEKMTAILEKQGYKVSKPKKK